MCVCVCVQSYFDVYPGSFGTHDRLGDARCGGQERAMRHVLHLAQARSCKQSLHGRDVRRLEADVLHLLLRHVSGAEAAAVLNRSHSFV